MYYRTYTGLTELILVLQNLDMYLRSYTCLTEHILILRILYLSYETYTGLTELILVLQNLFLYFGYGSTRRYYRTFTGTKVPVGTIEQIPYTEVLVGTTGLILILRIREYSKVLQNLYLLTDTRVPVGTTGLILHLPIQEYP